MFIAQSSSDGAGLTNFILIVALFGALFLFMSWRSRKRAREREAFLATITVGDRVRTYGGIIGKVQSLDDENAVIVSEGTKLRIVRSAIATRIDSS